MMNMVYSNIGKVTIQKRRAGNYMMTIPSEAVRGLGIKGGEKIQVYVDFAIKQLVYKLPER